MHNTRHFTLESIWSNVSSNIDYLDTVRNTDICQGGGVGDLRQVNVHQLHIEQLGDVNTVKLSFIFGLKTCRNW